MPYYITTYEGKTIEVAYDVHRILNMEKYGIQGFRIIAASHIKNGNRDKPERTPWEIFVKRTLRLGFLMGAIQSPLYGLTLFDDKTSTWYELYCPKWGIVSILNYKKGD